MQRRRRGRSNLLGVGGILILLVVLIAVFPSEMRYAIAKFDNEVRVRSRSLP